MGMGEPFHNEAAIYEAVTALLSPELFHHPARYILISTVGIPDAMIRCSRRFPDDQSRAELAQRSARCPRTINSAGRQTLARRPSGRNRRE